MLLLLAGPAWAESEPEIGPQPAMAAPAVAEKAPADEFGSWLYGPEKKSSAAPAASAAAIAGDGAIYRGLLWTLLLMGAGAGVVLALRRRGGLGRRWLGSSELAVLGRTHLSPKHAVYTVRVASQVLILGVSADRITALGEVTDPAALARLVEQRAAADAGGAAAEFRRALQSGPEGGAAGDDYLGRLSQASSALDRVRARLATLRA